MKYDIKFLGSGNLFRDPLARQHPFNRDGDEVDKEFSKYPATTEYKEPPLFFHIIKYCFHTVFVLFGLLLVWEILF